MATKYQCVVCLETSTVEWHIQGNWCCSGKWCRTCNQSMMDKGLSCPTCRAPLNARKSLVSPSTHSPSTSPSTPSPSTPSTITAHAQSTSHYSFWVLMSDAFKYHNEQINALRFRTINGEMMNVNQITGNKYIKAQKIWELAEDREAIVREINSFFSS